MYYFYRLYSQLIENRPHPVDDFKDQNHLQGVEDFKTANHPPPADDLLKEICSIPWYHQRTIIDKCTGDAKKALFSYTVFKEMDGYDCPYQNPPSRFQMQCKNIRFGSVMYLPLDMICDEDTMSADSWSM